MKYGLKKILLSLFLIGLCHYVFADDQISSKNCEIEKKDLVTIAIDTNIVRFQYTGYPEVRFRLDLLDNIKPIAKVGEVFFFEIDKNQLDSTYLGIERLQQVGGPEVVGKKVSLSELLARPNNPISINTEISGRVYTSKYNILINTMKTELFGKSILEFSITATEEGPLGYSGCES